MVKGRQQCPNKEVIKETTATIALNSLIEESQNYGSSIRSHLHTINGSFKNNISQWFHNQPIELNKTSVIGHKNITHRSLKTRPFSTNIPKSNHLNRACFLKIQSPQFNVPHLQNQLSKVYLHPERQKQSVAIKRIKREYLKNSFFKKAKTQENQSQNFQVQSLERSKQMKTANFPERREVKRDTPKHQSLFLERYTRLKSKLSPYLRIKSKPCQRLALMLFERQKLANKSLSIKSQFLLLKSFLEKEKM